MTEKPVTPPRHCRDCGTSLAGRHGSAKTCLNCRAARQREIVSQHYQATRKLKGNPR